MRTNRQPPVKSQARVNIMRGTAYLTQGFIFYNVLFILCPSSFPATQVGPNSTYHIRVSQQDSDVRLIGQEVLVFHDIHAQSSVGFYNISQANSL